MIIRLQVTYMIHSDNSKSYWLQFGETHPKQPTVKLSKKQADQIVKDLSLTSTKMQWDNVRATIYT